MDSPSSTSTTAKSGAPSVLYVTLGCAKNECDTDRMRAILRTDGFSEASSVEDADVVLVNTCSFLAEATREGIETTLELAEAAQSGVRSKPIVMCGCIPSRYGADLEGELPEVAAFVPVPEEDDIALVVRGVLGMSSASVAHAPWSAPMRTTQGASAFVKISDGCSRFCSFCAIPFIRGTYASRSLEEVLSEVRSLIEGGAREIILIGQDTGVWGEDLPGTPDLADLLVEVDAIAAPADVWVRVLYLQPEGMTDKLVEAIASLPSVLPYIDIPIQHSEAHVLTDMGRSGTPEELHALFARLRERIPGITLRSTAMAGFPGETEEDFDALLDFLEQESFDYCSVFAYSAEDGTAAATLPGQVDEQIKLDRAQELQDLSERMGFVSAAAHVGETVDVLVDGLGESDEGYELIGHARFQAPDTDGVVHIESGEASVGDIIRVRITDSFCYDLVGEMVGEEDA